MISVILYNYIEGSVKEVDINMCEYHVEEDGRGKTSLR